MAQRVMPGSLVPQFGGPVLTEARAIGGAATTADAAAHDCRGLLSASIDNNDSLDLDQLSVAEPLAEGRVSVLIAPIRR